MSRPRITYTARHDTTLEGEVAVLANVYRFLLDHARKSAAGISSANGTILRNTEEVSHVDRRPD